MRLGRWTGMMLWRWTWMVIWRGSVVRKIAVIFLVAHRRFIVVLRSDSVVFFIHSTMVAVSNFHSVVRYIACVSTHRIGIRRNEHTSHQHGP